MKSLCWRRDRAGFLAVLFMVCLSGLAKAEEGRPNVLFLLVDDMGYGDLSCYGAPDARTPRLDALAAEGIRFTQYLAGGAECTPTRTALLTGRYPQRQLGLECAIGTGNVGRYDEAEAAAEKGRLGLPADEAVLPRVYRERGYATGIFGKWHLGYEEAFHPHRFGFDRFFGILGGNCDYFTHREHSPIPVLYEDAQPVEEDGYLTHLITERALTFLEGHGEKPFFLYVPYTTPHFPFQGPGDAGRRWTEEEWTEGSREAYVTMLEDMDANVGRLLDKLEALGLEEETLVLFGSDHGAMGPGRNLPFRGSKGGLFEGGLRTAMMARWPGHLPAGRVSDRLCTTMDFTYSLARMAGASEATLAGLDGEDILAQEVANEREGQEPRTLCWRARRGDRTWKAVRHGPWKYVTKREGENVEEWLFHLERDPGEMENLLTTPANGETLGALKERLAAWEKAVSPRRSGG